MPKHTITLNLRYNLSDSKWAQVWEEYKQMDGWKEHANTPSWYGIEGDTLYINASSEPSGLVLDGTIETNHWIAWLTVLCARLSIVLKREIHDAEF